MERAVNCSGDVSPTRFDEFQEVAMGKEEGGQDGSSVNVASSPVASSSVNVASSPVNVASPPINTSPMKSPTNSTPPPIHSTPMKPPANPPPHSPVTNPVTISPTPHVSQDPPLPQTPKPVVLPNSQQLSFDAEDEELIRLLEQEEASMSLANTQSKDVSKLLPHSEIEHLFDISQVEQSQNSNVPLESSLREDVFRLSADRTSEERSHDSGKPTSVSLTFDDMDDLIGDDLKGFL